jgi:ribosomal protein S18 acetylase RimI-like enzyme
MTVADRGDVTARARAWRNSRLEAICDEIEPWAHGRVMRTPSRADYWELNVVLVEEDPGMSASELIAFAEQALDGFEHCALNFDDADAAGALRPDFEAAGWKASRLVWMLHEEPLPPGREEVVEEVPYDAVASLREAWQEEDFPGVDQGDFHAQARELALARGVQVLAVIEGGEPLAFAQLERVGDAAEVTQVFVHPEHRGGGRGTALTRAAVEVAGDVPDLWIVADDEDRPKELYRRLGFRPAWTALELLRVPGAG